MFRFLLALCILVQCYWGLPAFAETAFLDRLRYRLEVLPAMQPQEVSGIGLINPEAIRFLYSNLSFQPIWLDDKGQINRHGQELLAELALAKNHGLDVEDYHLSRLEALLNSSEGDTVGQRVDTELLLSDGLLLYAFHTKHGKINPETLVARWTVDKTTVEELLAALNESEPSIRHWLAALRPKSKVYQLLQHELSTLQLRERRSLALTETLKPGQRHAQVTVLASALQEFHYLDDAFQGDVYGPELKNAVIQFQQEHSLEGDGVVGPATRWALDSLYTGDAQSIQVNMERWRWMPERLEQNYIAVNIASFNLRYVFAGKTALKMKTVVGKSYRKTPVFSGDMRYLVVNPSWNVPHKIAANDLLPKIKADPNFLSHMGMLVLQGWGQDQQQIDPLAVDWAQVTNAKFPYHLRQLPGEKNALGRVKFMFPNEHGVYLHDTNDKSLFQKSARAFSSGCIRLENPIELMALISQNHASLSSSQVQALLGSTKESTVVLKEKLPVHIQYWTVWADDDDRVHYRYDIYERDDAILKGLQSNYLEHRG